MRSQQSPNLTPARTVFMPSKAVSRFDFRTFEIVVSHVSGADYLLEVRSCQGLTNKLATFYP
jgi:hypothetical protein